MTAYKVGVPRNYEGIKIASNAVTAALRERHMPQLSHVAQALGEDAVRPHVFMHALMRFVEYGRKRGVLDYARRNRENLPIHSFDTANKPRFRLLDDNLPSHYYLTSMETVLAQIHDLEEESGKNLMGALIIGDVIKHLFGEDIGEDADLLTNMNALLWGSLENRVLQLPVIDQSGVYEVLSERKNKVIENPERYAGGIKHQYERVSQALRDFKMYIDGGDVRQYMPQSERTRLLDTISEIESSVREKKEGKLLEPSYVINRITEQYNRVMRLVEDCRDTGEGGSELLLPDEPGYLWVVEQRLYSDYIDNIMRTVRSNVSSASNNGLTDDDNSLVPAIVKIADSTSTVAVMDSALTNARSIYTKAGIIIGAGIGLIEDLRGYKGLHQEEEHQNGHARLQMAVDYLFRNLNAIIDHHTVSLQSSSRIDDSWERDLGKFKIMKKGLLGLEERVAAMMGSDGLPDGATRHRLFP